MNLFSFVDEPFTDNAKIDYKKLYEVSYEQQRLMDDLVDLEIESIDKIIQKIKSDPEPYNIKERELDLWENVKKQAINGRRTGSGITGLADMLAALGVKYDSDEALEIIDEVMKTKMEGELDCTIDLSILRGSFENQDVNKEFAISQIGTLDYGFNNWYDFVLKQFPEQAYRMAKYKRRNISFSTIAPTGSVSILTQTSSGCEPVFMPFYMRRKKINPNDKNSRIDFTDQNGDKWQEFPVLHTKFRDWCYQYYLDNYKDEFDETFDQIMLNIETVETLFERSPWYKSTANDIDWEYRLKMQEVLQKYTTNAISSTLNLPENTSVDTVSQIYMKASQMGLKGVTIYREGSRSGVLVSNDSKPKKGFEQHDAPKRPKVLLGEIHKTTVKGTEYLVVIGLMENKPYEVFAQENKWNIKGNHLQIDIVKVKSGRYDIYIKDELVIEDFTKDMKPVEEDITRGYSYGLRHGGSVQYAVEQLSKSKSSMVDFSKAISRVLKRYLSEKEILNRAKCSNCGSSNLKYEEGCMTCLDCGSSKCN